MEDLPVNQNQRYNLSLPPPHWEKSPTISTYAAMTCTLIDDFFRLHRRKAARSSRSYRASVLANPPDNYPAPVCLLSVCPPFLAELCHRKHNKLVLAVSFNLCVLNDTGALTPPPTEHNQLRDWHGQFPIGEGIKSLEEIGFQGRANVNQLPQPRPPAQLNQPRFGGRVGGSEVGSERAAGRVRSWSRVWIRRVGGRRGEEAGQPRGGYTTPPRAWHSVGWQAEDGLIPPASPPPSGPNSSPPPPPPPPLPPPPPPPKGHRVSLSLMVVPEGTVTRKSDRPLFQRVYVKMKSFRTQGGGRSGRPTKLTAPLINDLHLAALYDEKKQWEEEALALRAEKTALVIDVTQLESELRAAIRDANSAVDGVRAADPFIKNYEETNNLKWQIRSSLKTEWQLTKERDAALEKAAAAARAERFSKAVATSASFDRTAAVRRAAALDTRLQSVSARANDAVSRARASNSEVKELSSRVTKITDELTRSREDATVNLGEAEKLRETLEDTERRVGDVEAELSEQRQLTAPKRGRPAGHRGAEMIGSLWESYTYDARRQALWRHAEEVKEKLTEAGIEDWLPGSLAVVLDSIADDAGTSWVDLLMGTRPFSKRKCDLIGELRDIANAEWGADLATYALVKVGLSSRQYQDLRVAFCRNMYCPVDALEDGVFDARCRMVTPRPWYTCPVLGKTFNLPEPLPPYNMVKASMEESLKPLGLQLAVLCVDTTASTPSTLR